MNLLNVEEVSKSYNDKILFNKINLGINEGDKIGIIGINGVGKSTLLKIIAGTETTDEGRVVKGSTVRVNYLSQNPYFEADATVLEQVFNGNSTIMKVVRDYEKALLHPDVNNDLIIKLASQMDALNAWSFESEAKMILTKLGISNFDDKVDTLSGGQKKRIALAAALITPSELLILDEPTNHLDNVTIDWLEDYLNRRKGAFIMVTHDRYFLDRVIHEIVELENGNIYSYSGNYSNFIEQKLQRQELEAAEDRKRQTLFKKELAWIRKGAKARTTKQKSRIDRFTLLSDEMIDESDEKMEISVANSRLGKKIIEIEHINKSYGEKKIIEDFNYIVLRNDRIGIIGANGSGKTTLINIMSGLLPYDSGKIEIGETVKISVFSQDSYHINEDQRVIEYIRDAAEYIETATGERISASQMLEKFLFFGASQWSPISKLSGGEKRRLHLLRVLMEAPNVLFLDEPTNDLDIETLTILEDYIDSFSGAVITVSHDRYFLDKIAGKIFAFEGNRKIEQYVGNYSDYIEKYKNKCKDENEQEDQKQKKANVNLNIDSTKKTEREQKEKQLKFSYKEQKEFDEIDGIIAELESSIVDIERRMQKEAADYMKLQELMDQKNEINDKLNQKMERWIYLNELADSIKEIKEQK